MLYLYVYNTLSIVTTTAPILILVVLLLLLGAKGAHLESRKVKLRSFFKKKDQIRF